MRAQHTIGKSFHKSLHVHHCMIKIISFFDEYRTLLQETQRRKAEEEQEMRASFSVSLHDKAAGVAVISASSTDASTMLPSRNPSESRGLLPLRTTPHQTSSIGGLRRMVSETGAHSTVPAGAAAAVVVSGGAVGGLRRMTSATGDPAFPRRTTETGGNSTAGGGSGGGVGGAVGGAVGGLRRMSSLTGEQASRASLINNNINNDNARLPLSRFSATKEGDADSAVSNPMRK